LSKSQASASFFEKKEAKKLSLLRAVAPSEQTPPVNESFLVTFFQKSNCFFLSSLNPL
jgi:hypothetical protein